MLGRSKNQQLAGAYHFTKKKRKKKTSCPGAYALLVLLPLFKATQIGYLGRAKMLFIYSLCQSTAGQGDAKQNLARRGDEGKRRWKSGQKMTADRHRPSTLVQAWELLSSSGSKAKLAPKPCIDLQNRTKRLKTVYVGGNHKGRTDRRAFLTDRLQWAVEGDMFEARATRLGTTMTSARVTYPRMERDSPACMFVLFWCPALRSAAMFSASITRLLLVSCYVNWTSVNFVCCMWVHVQYARHS